MKVVGACLVVTLGILGVLTHFALAAIAIRRATPLIAFAPAGVRVEMWIPPHEDNRRLEVRCQNEEFYRESDVQLDGDKSGALQSVEWRALPEGIYEVQASLWGIHGLRGSDRIQVQRQ